MERFNDINLCIDCIDKECGLIDGQECEKCIVFLFEKLIIENKQQTTSSCIHNDYVDYKVILWNI